MERPAQFITAPAPDWPGEVAVQLNSAWNTADIQVRRNGANCLAQVHERMHHLLELQRVDVIYLELPLDQGETDGLCRGAEEAGFFFAGLGPSSVTDGGIPCTSST